MRVKNLRDFLPRNEVGGPVRDEPVILFTGPVEIVSSAGRTKQERVSHVDWEGIVRRGTAREQRPEQKEERESFNRLHILDYFVRALHIHIRAACP